MSLVSLRKFSEADIEKKVEWINDSENNAFLHYNLPLNFEDTKKWFLQNKNNKSRCDMIILYDNIPVGVIGKISKIRKANITSLLVTITTDAKAYHSTLQN